MSGNHKTNVMQRQSQLKVFKSGDYEYIYVYYKLRNGIIRINTENKYIKSYMNKDLSYNKNMPDYIKLNQKSERLQKKVDTYIFECFQSTYPTVSQKQCLEMIDKLHFDTKSKKIVSIERPKPQPKIKNNFLELFNEFESFKKTELLNKASLKDYKSLYNSLLDYQSEKKLIITCEMVNEKDFFNRFRNYLGIKHSVGKTKGELNNNTVHKRFSSLKTFLRWIEEKEIFVFRKSLYDYKIQKFNTDFVILNREEIRLLENLIINNPYWQKIIDVFICNCFMSLRFIDLQTFAKGKFLQDEDGDYYYVKKNEKTNRSIEIPITKTALAILKKYNFELPVYTNQYFNRELQSIFEHYNLFDEKIQKQELKNGEPSVKYYLKREMITSHTARRSYITNAITQNVGFNAIQASTGHTQLSTLSKYVKRNKNKAQMSAID